LRRRRRTQRRRRCRADGHCAVKPQSTGKATPVTKLASSLARNATPAATSSGARQGARHALRLEAAHHFSADQPGSIEFTRMPSRAQVIATSRLTPITTAQRHFVHCRRAGGDAGAAFTGMSGWPGSRVSRVSTSPHYAEARTRGARQRDSQEERQHADFAKCSGAKREGRSSDRPLQCGGPGSVESGGGRWAGPQSPSSGGSLRGREGIFWASGK
jgi:hypothetical protein